jgi:serine protease AprX
MVSVKVLVEIEDERQESFQSFEAAVASEAVAFAEAEALLEPFAGVGLNLDEEVVPIPLLSTSRSLDGSMSRALADFSGSDASPDLPAASMVVAAEVDQDRLEDLRSREGVTVWPNSEIVLFETDPLGLRQSDADPDDEDAIDLARSRAGGDCRPFRSGVDLATIRRLLGVEGVWGDGWRGQNVTVAVLDEGIDGSVYPVSGGFSRTGAQEPGTAAVDSHGSMCAADILVAAPWARLYDYPFLGIPRSGGALAMFQAVLDHRRLEGTPHVTNNSWGFAGVPPRELSPGHEVHDLNHPLHRKIREVVASGAATFFAAGNCGQDCPSGNCHTSGIGPSRSIHASNSLEEVITIAAVNSRHERIGYSSQGPGMFAPEKPDLAAYSHFFGNFGPGRPAGTGQPFDNGTSAAAPVAAGVGALLLSAFPDLDPMRLRDALIAGATRVSSHPWDRDHGRGIINAAASYTHLKRNAP